MSAKKNATTSAKKPGTTDKKDKKSEGDWKAVQDRQPLPPWTLRVNGTPKMPTPQHKPALKRGVPQGINPRILLLDLVATAPSGPTTPVVTPVPVSYEERGQQEFDQVTIRSTVNTEPGATIDVEVVH